MEEKKPTQYITADNISEDLLRAFKAHQNFYTRLTEDMKVHPLGNIKIGLTDDFEPVELTIVL